MSVTEMFQGTSPLNLSKDCALGRQGQRGSRADLYRVLRGWRPGSSS